MNRVICSECETVKHCMQHGCIPKVNTLKEKPVVYYVGVPQFELWNPTDEIARIPFVINHPLLGKCYDVRTSKVLAKFSDGSFETKNTVYKPMASEGMGS